MDLNTYHIVLLNTSAGKDSLVMLDRFVFVIFIGVPVV
jgi:hypothetical protein